MHTATGFRSISSLLRPRNVRFLGSTLAMSTSSASLEVEVKFHLIDTDLKKLEQRILDLGFSSKGDAYRMVDWYFDTPRYDLVRQDCWLRFRRNDSKQGQWELKRGQTNTDRTTVYQEIEGIPGFMTALSLLPTDASNKPAPAIPNDLASFDDDVPALPQADSGLIPFARIVTDRTSYTRVDNGTGNLSIDLDTTDFGHAVGEVEAVVESEDELPLARARIQETLEQLLGSKNNEALTNKPAQGKLEVYIETRRPELYRILVDAGVM